ncbi:serine/threonine-protein kinase haspin [Lates japonicus]|uniref:Serine/threonine-protein kinase haspin n=1 Tax=Lates japonicus TaxID=270547 RepID=A0AAD3RGA6_LATJO|nr:serine/threonine-protein kinase haspin [Lates japonicus]
MNPAKPLILKTYGKHRRELTAWVSLENRKQAFDSTSSATDGDVSVFEPAKPAKIRERRASVASRRTARPAKQKAMKCLTEKSLNEENISNEENIFIPSPPPLPPPQLAQQSKTTRGRKVSVCSGKAVRPAKRKAVSCLPVNSSDEENISRPSPPCPQPVQQSKTTRRSRLEAAPGVLMRQRGRQTPVTSESEEDSVSAPKCHKKSVQMKRDSCVHPPSVGRFVTRRRRGAAIKPKLPKAIIKNSVNAGGTSSFATNILREISLNESADHSLGPCTRKPIFCSTPSAASLSQRPHLKPFPISDKSSTSPTMSKEKGGACSRPTWDYSGRCVSRHECESLKTAAAPLRARGRTCQGWDCSISELSPHTTNSQGSWSHHEFLPPQRGVTNLSSLLADLTPNTTPGDTQGRLLFIVWAWCYSLQGVYTCSAHLDGRAGAADISQDLFTHPLCDTTPKHLRHSCTMIPWDLHWGNVLAKTTKQKKGELS